MHLFACAAATFWGEWTEVGLLRGLARSPALAEAGVEVKWFLGYRLLEVFRGLSR